MTEQPVGQKVAVVLLRNRGVKLSDAELAAAEPLIGYIRRGEGYGAGSPSISNRTVSYTCGRLAAAP